MQRRTGPLVVVVVIAMVGIVSFRLPPLNVAGGLFAQALAPVQQFVRDPVREVGNVVSTIQEMGELRGENARLREQLELLRGDAIRATEIARENEQLRDQINLKRDRPTLQWIMARVIDRDANNLLRSVAIDRGSDDGIAVGMTVITPGGLVGQIVRASQRTARVLLITDVGSSVTAIIQGSRFDGVVSGRGTPYLVMRYIRQTAVVKTGDRVITSGIGGIFPDGIPIGRVVSVSKKDIDLFQEAQIEPDTDLGGLEMVLVVTNHVPLRLE